MIKLFLASITLLLLGTAAVAEEILIKPKLGDVIRIEIPNAPEPDPDPDPGVQPPAAPTELVAQAAGHDRILLAWKDNSQNEKGFQIQISASGQADQFTDAGENPAVAGLSPETTYFFRVRSYNDGGPSNWTAVANAKTERAPPVVPGDYPTPATRQPGPNAQRIQPNQLLTGILRANTEYIVQTGQVRGTFDIPEGAALFAEGAVRIDGVANKITSNTGKKSFVKGFAFVGGGAQGSSAENNRVILRVPGGADGVTLVDCLVKGGTDGGLGVMGSTATLVRCVFEGNGSFGLGGTRAHFLRAYDCTVIGNNTRNVADGGGGKFTRSVDQVFGRTTWKDNTGPGLWHDFENGKIIVSDCKFINNHTKGRFGGNCWMFEVSQGPALASKSMLDGRGGNEGAFNFGAKDFVIDNCTIVGGSKGAVVDEPRGDNDHDWAITGLVVKNSIIVHSDASKRITGKWKDGGGNTFKASLN